MSREYIRRQNRSSSLKNDASLLQQRSFDPSTYLPLQAKSSPEGSKPPQNDSSKKSLELDLSKISVYAPGTPPPPPIQSSAIPIESRSRMKQPKPLVQREVKEEDEIMMKPMVNRKEAITTGLPDNLKERIENLSGYSMDDVKVHYNSDKPTQLQAHAYTQGTDIYLAPGQEKHLPHEALHVVQQKQGRVKPLKG